jgi:hypothetical protein
MGYPSALKLGIKISNFSELFGNILCSIGINYPFRLFRRGLNVIQLRRKLVPISLRYLGGMQLNAQIILKEV